MINGEHTEKKLPSHDQILCRLQHFHDFLLWEIREVGKEENNTPEIEAQFIQEKFQLIFEDILCEYQLY